MAELSSQQYQAATLLAAGMSCKDVAEHISVTPQTISNWRPQIDFQRCVQQQQRIVLVQTREQARALVVEALAEVRSLMKDSESESIRLRAAPEILKGTGVVAHSQQNHRLWQTIDQI